MQVKKPARRLSVAMSSIAILVVGILGVVYAATSTGGSANAAGAPVIENVEQQLYGPSLKVDGPLGKCTVTTPSSTSYHLEMENVIKGFSCTFKLLNLNKGNRPVRLASITDTFGHSGSEGQDYERSFTGCDLGTVIPVGGGVDCEITYTAVHTPDSSPPDDWDYIWNWEVVPD